MDQELIKTLSQIECCYECGDMDHYEGWGPLGVDGAAVLIKALSQLGYTLKNEEDLR